MADTKKPAPTEISETREVKTTRGTSIEFVGPGVGEDLDRETGSGRSTSAPGAAGGGTYLVKEQDGVAAPIGSHYMPDGSLMSDAAHVVKYGYADAKIESFTFNTKDISPLGGSKSFTIRGTENAVFSLEIYDDSDSRNYYNFDTKTWSTALYRLSNVELKRKYTFLVNFPTIVFSDATCVTTTDPTVTHSDDDGKIKAGMTVTGSGVPAGATVASVTSDLEFELSAATTSSINPTTLTFGGLLKKYTINLYAETVGNVKTTHANFIDYRNSDNTINLNRSTGSQSNLLTKILYQDAIKNLNLSCIAPSLYATSANTVAATTSSTNRITIDSGDESTDVATDINIVRVGDKVTTTGIAAAAHALVTKIDPDGDNTNEIEISVTDSVTNNAAITFTPPFNGVTPHSTDSTSGQDTFEVISGGSLISTFSITLTAQAGRTFSQIKTPTTDDLCAFTTVTFGSAALPIDGEDVSSSTFYRWPIDNIVGLSGGMTLDPARSGTGVNTTTPAIISSYESTYTGYKITNRKYAADASSTTVTDVYVRAVSTNDIATTVDRYGEPTVQTGNIVFNTQQADALKSDSGVRIFAYGASNIKKLTGVDVNISNVNVALTQISTTTTAAVINSTTIPVTECQNISSLSTLRGMGVTSLSSGRVVAPTVVSKNAVSGNGNVVVATAQNLESGQTVFFDRASNVATITGNIELSNMSTSDVTLYFDVERFLRSI